MRNPDRARPLRVVSVSLGASARDACVEMSLLGRTVLLERRGVDGDAQAARRLFGTLRDEVDAFGLGGADLHLEVAGRRYVMRESAAIVRHAGDTPVVCGAGLKHTLERRAVHTLNDVMAWHGARVLVPSSVDRWGMTEAIMDAGANVTMGDLAFLLGIPLPLRDRSRFASVTHALAPVVTKLPMAWLYPTGAKQATRVGGWRETWFHDADVIAGDWHLIARYAPSDLRGKRILTNTTTVQDLDDLARRGVDRVATTTPRIGGRSLPTNLLEAAFVAVAGRFPLSSADLATLVDEADLRPDVWSAS